MAAAGEGPFCPFCRNAKALAARDLKFDIYDHIQTCPARPPQHCGDGMSLYSGEVAGIYEEGWECLSCGERKPLFRCRGEYSREFKILSPLGEP